MAKGTSDWASIEREYRGGDTSVSAIGRKHGLSHTAINKRAKKERWTRNQSEVSSASDVSGQTAAQPQAKGPLTPKQQRFVEEYVVDLNGKHAAIRAGYSATSAEGQASRLLSDAKVQQAVSALQGQRAERT